MCAERVAVFKAISEGARKFRRVAVAADTESLTPPCGACRQILWEFCGDIELVLVNLHGKTETFRLERLFPRPFDASYLVACSSAVLAAAPPNPPTGSGCARYVITMDAQRRVIENGAVAMRGDRIVGRGHEGGDRRDAFRRSSGSTGPTRSSLPG